MIPSHEEVTVVRANRRKRILEIVDLGTNERRGIQMRGVGLLLMLTILGFPPLALSRTMGEPPTGHLTGKTTLSSPSQDPYGPTKAQVQIAYEKLPLSFEANRGQIDTQVKYLARGHGYNLLVNSTELVLVLRKPHPVGRVISAPSLPFSRGTRRDSERERASPAVLRMTLVGANPQPEILGLDELPGKTNYLIGSDPSRWRSNIPTYAKVKYGAVYPGVDLVYYGNQHQLEYDFVVAPGADPKLIALHFEGMQRLSIDVQGDLIIHTVNEPIRLHRPRIYQEMNGVRQEVSGGYVLRDTHRVGFQVGAYDPAVPLIIDPVLVYGTYLGGSGDDVGLGIAVDAAGHAYVTGYTTSADFPPQVGLQGNLGGGSDAFVTKLDSTGSALVYSTYLGGSGDDGSNGIAVDAAGHAYVTGFTSSPDFPTVNPFQASPGGNRDAFVAKLTPTGSAVAYATYLGGTEEEWGLGIAVDAAGHAFVAGFTASSDFPTLNPLQASSGGNGDAFVAKLSPAGAALAYATYLGGAEEEWGLGIAVDAADHAYVTGFTSSPDFPTASPVQGTYGGNRDAFVAKLSPTGMGLVYATYLGGTEEEWGLAIAVDAADHAYVTGFTSSADFPTRTPLQGTIRGASDAFVAKLDPAGSTLVSSTYLGGSGDDGSNGIAVDSTGHIYVTGYTSSPDFPVVDPVQASPGGKWDAFAAKLTPTGAALAYATYLGGSGEDSGFAIALDAAGQAHVTGWTDSPDFPTPAPLQLPLGRSDAFVVKIGGSGDDETGVVLTSADVAKAAQRLFESAEDNWRNQRWPEALTAYRHVTSSLSSPYVSKAHIQIGRYNKYQRRWNEAIDEYARAISKARVTRDVEDAQTSIAAVHITRGDYEAALSICREVLSKTTDWQQVKYCTYWIKELKRRVSFGGDSAACNTCGPSALLELFRLKGIALTRDERDRINVVARDGDSLADLKRKAESKGLRLQGARLSIGQLKDLNTPFIALVEDPKHYVVISGANLDGIRTVDPEYGLVTTIIPESEFLKRWKGYALIPGEVPKHLILASLTAREMETLSGRVCFCCPDSNSGTQTSNTEFEPTSCSIGGARAGFGMPGLLVNTVNLNLVVQDTDLSFKGRGPSVSITRTYNADDFRDGPFGRSWTFNYNILLTANPDGSVDIRRETGTIHHFTWVGGGNYISPRGVDDTLTRNSDGTYALKRKRGRLIQTFGPEGSLRSMSDRQGNSVTFQYDSNAQLVSITDAVGRVTTLEYGANGKIASIRDPIGRTARFAYDSNNNLVASTDMAGTTVSFSYDNPSCPGGTCSYMTSITTPKGVTRITYATSFEGFALQTVTDALGNTKSYGTFESHLRVRIVDENGNARFFTNTFESYTAGITDAVGNATAFEYDFRGKRTGLTDARGSKTGLSYDDRSNLTRMTDPLGNAVSLEYDGRDNLTSLREPPTSGNPQGNTYSYRYDSQDNLIEVTDPANGVTRFNYDALGQLTRLTDARGQATSFEYDNQGNLRSMTSPLGHRTSYSHDAVGRGLSVTTPKGDTIRYGYDGLDRVTSVAYPDGNTMSYTYDCCNLRTVSDRKGTLSFEYDNANRLVRFTNINGKAIQYAYDKVGNLTTLTYPDGKLVSYEYDTANRLKKVTDWLGSMVTYNYDAAGSLISSVTSGGLVTAYQYDNANRLIGVANVKADGTILSYYKYSLDSLGNRTVAAVREPLAPSLQDTAINYIHDPENRLISAGGTTFGYDSNGNMISEGAGSAARNYAYDLNDRLVRAAVNGQTTVYEYDALGHRISKTANGTITRYVLDPNAPLSRVLAETDGDGAITRYYVYGLGLVSTITPAGQAYFYQYDGLGSTISLTDPSGNLVNRYAYDPFGNLSSNSTETITNPFRYVGRFGVMDDGTGLLYMRARYYAARAGRFLTKDPIYLAGGSWNLYAYVGNNPVKRADPLGLRTKWWDPTSWNPTKNCGWTKESYDEPTGPFKQLEQVCQVHDRALEESGPCWAVLNSNVIEAHINLIIQLPGAIISGGGNVVWGVIKIVLPNPSYW
jgi:RHS repeat-associated protein